MITEPFATGISWIHHIDPRLRIVSAAVFSILIAVSSRFSVLLAALAFSVVLIFLARLNLGEVVRRLAVVFGFLFLMWAVLPLTFEGESLYSIGYLTITRPGVELAAGITLKTTAVLLIFMALIATMTVVTLGHALNRLHFSGKLVHLMLMTYRYIFVIEDEYRRLRTAMKIRGFQAGTNMHSYRTFAYLIGMLFVRASVRAERVHHAMQCRGFKGQFYTMDNFASVGENRLFSIMMVFAISGLIILGY